MLLMLRQEIEQCLLNEYSTEKTGELINQIYFTFFELFKWLCKESIEVAMVPLKNVIHLYHFSERISEL